MIVYLLNRDLVSARVLAERFGVTTRTIQRDMEAIELSGIPIVTIQGPNGGYGIMENFKIHNQLVSVEDFYYIITALKSVSETLADDKIDNTLEKMKTLIPSRQTEFLSERNEKLSIDFTMLGGDPRHQESFKVVKEAVDSERLLRFTYTNNKLESIRRTVEPLTIAFKWRAWYLFAWCCEKGDFRTFRISRMRDPEILPTRFKRKDISFEEYLSKQEKNKSTPTTELTLRFDAPMRAIVEEFHCPDDCSEGPEGSLIVKASMPEDGWMYGFLLSYGEFVTVIDPPHVRENLKRSAEKIAKKY
ncbi:YafY family protein [Spirochaeta isovalerica]